MENIELVHSDITGKIIGSAIDVFKSLGSGFLEKVYENALVLELREAGLEVRQQCPIRVVYKGTTIGEYCADLLVEGKVIVEVKATPSLLPQHEAQLINYLKASGIKVGLVMNFGERMTFERKVV